jgi:hypothetical protein
MTPTDLLTEIRQLISDEGSVRWTDAVLRSYMYACELDIVKLHPESQYHTRVAAISTPILLTDNASSFTIGVKYRNAMVHFVVYRVFSEDSEDINNQKLAAEHFKLYQESMR